MEFHLSTLWLDPVTLLKTVGFFILLFFPLINFFLIFFIAISLTDELAEVQKKLTSTVQTSRALIFPLDYSINKSLLMSG